MEANKILKPRVKHTVQPHAAHTTEHTASQASAEVAQIRRAIANPHAATPDTLLLMQQRYGNQTVRRLLQGQTRRVPATIQRGLFDIFGKKDKGQKQEVPKTVDDAMRSDIFPYFLIYCRKNVGDEMPDFLEEYRNYKESPSLNLAAQIYNQYIDPNGNKPLNLQGDIKGRSRKEIEQITYAFLTPNVFNQKGAEMFEVAYKAVIFELRDPYIAFTKKSKQFLQWQE